MTAYDPAVHGSYGAWLRAKGIQIKGSRSTPRVRETRGENGHVVRTITELTPSGAIATTTNRTSRRGEHQDVHVHMPTITSSARVVTP